MQGTLAGIRVIEMGCVGPTPFAAMMLGDHGAEVIRVDKPDAGTVGVVSDRSKDVLLRSRKSLVVNLKQPDGVAVVRKLCRTADAFIEGFRPGVMERLGLGPEVLLADSAHLVYGRMTGWGQTGPNVAAAGHDLTYIAMTGNLHSYGRAGQKPTPPINAIGDFGGGGMLLAFGVMAALLSARATGKGQVVDCAMTDGAALLSSMIWGMLAEGSWRDERGVNLLDTGASYYGTYETSDGKHVALAALEPQFFAESLRLGGLGSDPAFSDQNNRCTWPAMAQRLTAFFKTKSRSDWSRIFAGSDACVSPVLSMNEAKQHPQNVERGAFIEVAGATQPLPAPRYSLTNPGTPTAPRRLGEDTKLVLAELGYDDYQISSLLAHGTVRD